MALVHWQPFQEMQTLRRQFDQLFDEIAGTNQEFRRNWTPAIEIQDTGDSLILRAEIPGVEGKDVDVQVAREAVAISGEHSYEKKAEEKGYFRSEFRYGKFQRMIPLPVPVQNEQAQAEFKHGILTLTLPKAEEVRYKAVRINLGDNQESVANLEQAKTLEMSNTPQQADSYQTANSSN